MRVVKNTKINDLINDELATAIKKHGKFNSSHEAYAVLLEETEELRDELDWIGTNMGAIWNVIKNNRDNDIPEFLNLIEEIISRVIEEAIQVSAMAKKFQMLIKKN